MEYPERKHPRLKGYDYSEVGTYFITICVQNKIKLFGEIIVNDEGAENRLTRLGEIAAEQVEELKARYQGLIIDNYVITRVCHQKSKTEPSANSVLLLK